VKIQHFSNKIANAFLNEFKKRQKQILIDYIRKDNIIAATLYQSWVNVSNRISTMWFHRPDSGAKISLKN